MTDLRGRIAQRLAPEPAAGTRRAGLAAVAISCTAWGVVGLLVRQLDLPAVTIAGFRLAFAALGVWLVGLFRPGDVMALPRPQRRRVALLGALMALNWWLFILAFQLTDVGVTVVLSFTWPLWVVLLSRALHLEVPDRGTLLALLCSLAGIALLAVRTDQPPGPQDVAGMAAALGTAVSMSVMVLVSRSVDIGVPSATVNFWQSAVGGVLLAPFALAGTGQGTLDLPAWGILALLGMVLTGVGNTLFVHGMRTLSVPETAVASYLEPVSATLLAALFLAEQPGPRGLAGMALLVGAGLWVTVRRGSGDA